jgi:Hypothetical glycosyl hydrolase family 15
MDAVEFDTAGRHRNAASAQGAPCANPQADTHAGPSHACSARLARSRASRPRRAVDRFTGALCGLALGVAGLLSGSGTAVAAEGDFPRLAHYMTGPAPLGDAYMQDYLAKLDWAMVNVWPGWRGSGGVTVEQALRAVKDRNPNTKLFIYVNNNELYDTSDGSDAFTELRNKVNSMGWWLYPSGAGGNRVKSTWGDVHYILNTSDYSPRDSSGRNFNEWFADWSIATYITNNPSVDGLLTDNVFWKPRVDGDWNRDGSTDSAGSSATQGMFRAGYRSYFERMKQRMPAGKLSLGNVADWYDAKRDGKTMPEFQGQLNGGVLEAAIGKSYSLETTLGWSGVMAAYRDTLAQLAAPKLLLFEQFGEINDYQAFRYGFTTALMDDGYYQFADITAQTRTVWFDEYDAKLGQALSSPPTSAWSKGVYRRDFENGIALVNPRGNGAVEVQLETGYRLISGRQAPSVNTGATVTTVRLNDRDGLILLRTTSRARPLPPTGLAVE